MLRSCLHVSSTFSAFFSLLFDNLLLTVVVPILPEVLREKQAPVLEKLHHNLNSTAQECFKDLFHLHLLKENTQLGLLFSTKALVQLIFNPVVGRITHRIGYKVPLCVGNFILFLCSLVFGLGDSYHFLLVGRSFHGVASSLIAISGMALVATENFDDTIRTKRLGRIMGAGALGVLIGYPFGSISFAFFGKETPFLILATFAILNTAIQFYGLNFPMEFERSDESVEINVESSKELLLLDGHKESSAGRGTSPLKFWKLLKDRSILIISIAVWLSTTSMAVLEPTLPIWLIDKIDPPDSLGYYLGTNHFGTLSLKVGRWKTSVISMGAIGTACFLLPLAKEVWQLALPHFTLGLGLGVIDASLMPLLAQIADEKFDAGYGVVYSLAQTSVALAYSLGPIIGGELVPLIGFPDLLRSIGFACLLYCPFIFLILEGESRCKDVDNEDGFKLTERMPLQFLKSSVQPDSSSYQRLFNDFDSD